MTTFSLSGVEMLRRRKKRISTQTAPAMPSTSTAALPFTMPCTSVSKSVTKATSPTGSARMTAWSRGRVVEASATARAGSSTKRWRNSPEHMPSTKKTAASRPNRRSRRRIMSVFTSRWSSASSRSRLWARVLVMASPMGSPPACRISSKGHNALQRSPCIERSWHPVLFCSRNFLPRMPAEHVQKSVRQERALTQGSFFAPLRTGRVTSGTCSWRIRSRRTCRCSSWRGEPP